MTILEQYGELALKSVQINLCLVDNNGIIKFCNKMAKQFAQPESMKLVGRHIHDVFHQGGNHTHGKDQCPLLRALETGEPVLRTPDVFHNGNGDGMWFEYSAYPLKDKGKYPVMLFSFLDASVSIRSQNELIEHQAKFKAVFLQAVYPKLLLDGTGEVLEANPAAKRVFVENIENTMLFDYFAPKSEKKLKAFWKSFKASGGRSERLDVVLNNDLDNRRYIFDISVSSDVRPNMHFMSLIDITEEAIQQEAQNQFIAVAGHELKTPLAVIRAYSELLQRKHRGDENTIKYVNKIHEKVDVLTRLINAMVDEIKLGAGKLEFNNREIDFNEYINEVVNDLKLSYKSNKILVKGKVKGKIETDPLRLTQVVSNLISNASKYSSPDTSILIHLLEDGNMIKVGVQDFGKGISRKEQGKLFSAFYRSPSAIKKNYPGIGLGLFISKQIIENYGGDMWVDSAWNKGSTFYFTLPKK